MAKKNDGVEAVAVSEAEFVPKPKTAKDPEVLAISRIKRVVSSLSPRSQHRVLMFVIEAAQEALRKEEQDRYTINEKNHYTQVSRSLQPNG